MASMVDSLRFIKSDTFDCQAGIYWRIIQKGKEAIPFLIEKLTDTTPTNIRYHCKKTPLNVGEVAHFALLEIASFPAFLVTRIQFDLIDVNEDGSSCWNFYEFLFMNKNKARYQKSMRDWYEREKTKYKLIRIAKRTQCQIRYGIRSYYDWKG
jgi:hypothetical protein